MDWVEDGLDVKEGYVRVAEVFFGRMICKFTKKYLILQAEKTITAMKPLVFKYLIAILLISLWTTSAAQDTILLSNGETFYIHCDTSAAGVIYDDGGPTGNYSVGFSGSVQFIFSPGDSLELWGSVDLEPQYDYVSVYDGDMWHSYYSSDSIHLMVLNGLMMVSFYSDGSVVQGGIELNYLLHPSSCSNGIGQFWCSSYTTTTSRVNWSAVNYTGPFVLTVNGQDTLVPYAYCNLTNLTRNTAYVCTVRSEADTASVQCERSLTFVTAQCENAITSVSAPEVTDSSITLAWTSESTGQYVVSQGTHSDTTSALQITYTGLQPNTSYLYSVLPLDDTCCTSCGMTQLVRTRCYQARVNGIRPLIGTDTVTLTADPADGYRWSTGATTQSIQVWQPGYYWLVAYTNGGCTDTLRFGISNVELDIDIDLPSYLCPGESTEVYVGLRPDANVRVSCFNDATLSDPTRIFLPDGVDCDPNSDHGCSYRSELEFSGFGNYQLMTDVNDIRYVMLDIEHSYIGDIYINITCPNGQNADILKFSGSGSSDCTSHIGMEHRGWSGGNNCGNCYLGLPYDSEDNTYPCDSTREENRAGTGWRYCWSNCNDAGYSYAPGDGIIYRYDNLVGSTFDSSNVAAGTNFYHPEQSLEALEGCPMNGTWYIEVIDGWGIDNGYIFGWELALNPNRLARTQYEPSVAQAVLEGQYATRNSDTTFTITAPANLDHDTTITYIVHIYDDDGNVFDTTFTIAFHPLFTRTFHDTIVENQLPYTIYGTTFEGEVTDRVFRLTGEGTCDSIITYSLHVIPNGFSFHDTTVCDDQLPLLWHGRTFTVAGTQNDTVLTPLGSDSILTLTVHVNPTYGFAFEDTICSNQSRTFEGTDYSAAGTYTHTYTTVGGCDSIRMLSLVVYPTSHVDTVADVCDRFTFGGTTYTVPGTDTIDLASLGTNVYGCDSTLTLFLTIRQSSSTDIYATACDSFSWQGQTLYAAPEGVLTYVTSNSVGCDSTVRLMSLLLHYTQMIDESDTVCASDMLGGYHWRDTLLSDAVSGIYGYTRQDSQGCDSLFTLDLTVLPTAFENVYDTIVENQAASWSYNGIALSHDTVLSLTVVRPSGCDSIVTYHLKVWPNVSHAFDSTICSDQWDTFSWQGLSAADTLTVVLTSSHGTDSTVTLYLHTVPSYSLSFFDTICSNGSVAFEGGSYSVAGSYPIHLHTSTTPQCDSIRTLHLTVFDTTVGDTLATACDTFLWYDNTYTASALDTLHRHYLNTAGCDSSVALHLTLHHRTFAVMDDSCPENFLPRQYIYLISHGDTSGVEMIIPNAAGCDSVITYSLHVWRNVSVTLDTAICAGALPTFSWNGQTSTLSPATGLIPGESLPTLTDTLHAVIPTVHGADSNITMLVHVRPEYSHQFYDTICDNSASYFVDLVYTLAGDYEHLLSSQYGCDSVVTLHLSVLPTYMAEFYDTIYFGQSIAFEGHTYSEPGDYSVVYATTSGCDSTLVLHLVGRNIVHRNVTDSLCQGDSLWFVNRYVSDAGTYYDTIFTGDFYLGDTVVQLDLEVLTPPSVAIDTSHVCDPEPMYILEAKTDVPYYQWFSIPYNPALEGQENEGRIAVSPSDSSWYYLYADYSQDPLCPAADSILLPPLFKVTPEIDLEPDHITLDERTITAYNRSQGRYSRHLWYVWYDGVQSFTSTDAVLTLQVPPAVDSVQITLQVFSQTCSYVTTVDVPIRRSGILFPNVFTPSQNLNNTFAGVGKGVLTYEIWIYDRRGDIVYHGTDMAQGWDGTKDGRPCPQGSYVYYCRYTDQLIPNGVQTVRGTVVLLR